MTAPLYAQLVPQADLKCFKNPMIDTESNGLNVSVFICAAKGFAILAIYLKVIGCILSKCLPDGTYNSLLLS